MKVCVTVPTYNERENITDLIKEITSVLKNNGIDGRIFVVDDNSPDGTADAVKALMAEYPVDILIRRAKCGLGAAYKDAFKMIIKKDYDVIVSMDADFSHDPKYIPALIEKIKSGADLVVGSRYMKGGRRVDCPYYKVLMSHMANLFVRLIDSLPITDVTTGYRAYRREVFEKIDLDRVASKGFEFLMEMIYRAHYLKFRIDQVPIVFVYRKKGKSKLSYKDASGFFFRALMLRFGTIFKKKDAFGA